MDPRTALAEGSAPSVAPEHASADAEGKDFAVEFDFEARRARAIPVAQAARSCFDGLSCWIDLDASDASQVRSTLAAMGVDRRAIEQVVDHPGDDGRHDVYAECLHLSVTVVAAHDGVVAPAPIDMVIAPRFIVTLHREPVELLAEIRRSYRHDFERYAKTLSFILFLVFDRLVDGYRKSLRALSREVSLFQTRIFGEADDRIFALVGEATRRLLAFRASMLAARGVLYQLSTRRSPFVSETSQPFLENMVDTLERLGADLSVERDILAETLNLYIGITSHRTNRVMNRLAVLSAIFLPLTFLCGVYGMNFKHMPELSWRYGYPAFWALVATIVTTLLVAMRRRRWI